MNFLLSKILIPIAHVFTGAFTKALPTLEASAKAELTNVEGSIVAFVKTDLGKLAVDAVGLVPATLSGGAAIAFAKTQFIADAKTAGHDLTTLGSGVVDWMVQTAYTFSAGVVGNLATAGL